ncbi:malto-oligosyltrehalose trehalohydrolase [Pseudomonas tohonis]|uniref:Malto-oligosyltrehalose trehalohydrolase n=1 Tax=Pseudomonas tohonis TaxID=2725477 RepID=A0A6J4E5E6_9PSED|nr:malto-oligosyltrehalose trehalohydrolase [Pseudomonas tohonis]BCG25032.1 malto-oligosyltrehalose trehalohydrolase [Pseudomonas tohonis]GJN55978.1 malto-oligosyltrehalose trehalohydrolase [Pseudomonas tohonis]
MFPLTRSHGALLEEDGTTRFALWAPDAGSVEVELADGSRHPLRAHGEGWYCSRLPLGAGTVYRYLIDGHLRVPDPASRAQEDGPHGFSRVVDPKAYRWRHADWRGRPWHEAVIYELHVGLLGGFDRVEALLPGLKELGVTAIELMPLGEFPGARNWGYDGVLPFAPDSSYGPPEALKRLIDSAHGLGLMVFIDVVYNHFGPDGNYLGQYAGAFFNRERKTPWGPAIDFRQVQVRDFFCENALMWVLDYRVDGLRFDAVHAITEKDFLVEMAGRLRAAAGKGRHLHLVLENEDNDVDLLEKGYDAQWNDDGHNVLHALLTGEREGYYADFATETTSKLARCLGEGFVYQGESTRRGHLRGQSSAHLPPTAFVLFLQNHDQVGNRAFGERLASLAEPDELKAATALLLLSPMIPLLFMGEEWGSRQPFLFFTSHNEELGRAVRDGRRNEFREFAVFADEQIRRSIPDPNALGTFTGSIPDCATCTEPGQQAWRVYYRRLLELRHAQLVPRLPGSQAIGTRVLEEKAVSASWRLGDGSLLRIDLNLASAPVRAPLPHDGARVIFSNRMDLDDYRQGLLAPRSVAVTLEDSA